MTSARIHRISTLLIAGCSFVAVVATAVTAASGVDGATVATIVAAAFGAAFTALPTILRELSDPSGGSPTPPSGT